MAFFLAISSLVLITHSLAITVLNARWINDEFRDLKKWNKELGGQIFGVLNDVSQVLVASQGVPIRLVLGPEKELVQFIVDLRKRNGGGTLLKKLTKRSGNGRHQIFCAPQGQSYIVIGHIP